MKNDLLKKTVILSYLQQGLKFNVPFVSKAVDEYFFIL
jgi:hypothetical protein